MYYYHVNQPFIDHQKNSTTTKIKIAGGCDDVDDNVASFLHVPH
jgi:hypothetical protein